MITKIKRQLNHLRQEPEEVRYEAAVKYVIYLSIAIAVLWLVVFLPLQLKLRQLLLDPEPAAESSADRNSNQN